jgi:DNA-binding MarR family transcriptional regulator
VPSDRQIDVIEEARRQWEQRWGADPSPAMAAVTSIMRVEQLLMAELNALLKPFDLTFPRYEALMLLSFSRRGSMPLGKVGDRLQVHRTAVTNIIDRLERSGYVRRVPHEHDRRTTLAEVTDEGRATAEAATAVLNEARFGLEGTSKRDLESLVETLRGIRQRAGDMR